MKIYTKKGDTGVTTLFGGKRIYKDDIRVVSYGTVDELTSYLSVVTTYISEPFDKDFFRQIQRDLYLIMGKLALADTSIKKLEESLNSIEKQIDKITKNLPELHNFIIPGTEKTSSNLNYARTICRRAERYVVSLLRDSNIEKKPQETDIKIIIKYLNRLSDLLFTYARLYGDDIPL
jgi:cob(I)alamin adenosyltransferase